MIHEGVASTATVDPKHCARYSEALLPTIAEMLEGYLLVLDPFAGTGERMLSIRQDAILVELEPRYAAISQRVTHRSYVGDATALRWPDRYFDAVCTSPTYGNRLADKQVDKYKRMNYTASIGGALQPNNSGAMQWGREYRDLHKLAWKEARRVLVPGGILVLNMKDHIRNRKRQRVTLWHMLYLLELGFTVERYVRVKVGAFNYGQNAKARIPYESVIMFRKSGV